MIEDMPGTGKTTLAKKLSELVAARFARIQFTPDLMPNDITGTSIYNQKNNAFEFHKGPCFANILLADEINRASPRTQSALLEAMEERQVSADGQTMPLPDPFFVIATENPAEMHGTYPLPEAQLDRFFVKLRLGYVSAEDEARILLDKAQNAAPRAEKPCLSPESLRLAMLASQAVCVSPALAGYAVAIARATREHPALKCGAGTRGSIALMRMAQAWACMQGREWVLPSDCSAVAHAVLAHRCIGKDQRLNQQSVRETLDHILETVQAPQ